MLFQFKYPLKNNLRTALYQELSSIDPELDPEEVEVLVDKRVLEYGVTSNISNLVCEDYSQS